MLNSFFRMGMQKRSVLQIKRKWHAIKSQGRCNVMLLFMLSAYKLLKLQISYGITNHAFLSALATRKENYSGTGGGAGTTLTDIDEQVLQVMTDRQSDLVDGISGGQEVGLPNSSANVRNVTEAVRTQQEVMNGCMC